jgi:maltose-binding protein MalE
MRDVFTPDASPLLSKTSQLLSAALARPVTPEYVKVSAQLQTMFETVITNTASSEDAVRRAAEFIDAITGLPLKSV